MKKILIILSIILVVAFASCSTQQSNDVSKDATNTEVTKEDGLLNKLTDTFSSDASKLEKQFKSINNENMTFFTDVDVSKTGNDIKLDFVVTENATSKFILSMFTLGLSIQTYNTTTNFDNLKINYLNSEKKVLATMTIPKKAIKDIFEYAEENNGNFMEENPYIDAYWKLSQVMYDASVPELMPTSMVDDLFGGFGSDADDIADALTKKVTHLEIECGYPENWDADAEDDGIVYHISPLSDDETVVPLEGTFDTKVYEMVQVDDWGFEYEKGKVLYTQTGELKGQDRLNYFDTWYGYNIQLSWDDIDPYMASSNDEGIMFVTFTDLEGNKFEAVIGEKNIYEACQLRES